ncbi:lipid droplet-associated protein [Gordonia malaquae]|uniref:lipid droplet-associated protein n=1 Tax=Gordonia malaquae TaxID=410332 RepID=UPI003015D806
MNRPPYPARVVAGLLVTTVEETRKLPTRVITLPMSAVSSALQAGMRLQQNIAELAIKGDEVLSPIFDKAEEQPEWARFDDEDEPAAAAVESVPEPEEDPTPAPASAPVAAPEPKADAAGRHALFSSVPADLAPGATTASPKSDESTGPVPDAVAALDYDSLTLAQLRAKVRTLDVDTLQVVAEYERANRNRTPFVTMIENRIAGHQKKADAGQ